MLHADAQVPCRTVLGAQVPSCGNVLAHGERIVGVKVYIGLGPGSLRNAGLGARQPPVALPSACDVVGWALRVDDHHEVEVKVLAELQTFEKDMQYEEGDESGVLPCIKHLASEVSTVADANGLQNRVNQHRPPSLPVGKKVRVRGAVALE